MAVSDISSHDIVCLTTQSHTGAMPMYRVYSWMMLKKSFHDYCQGQYRDNPQYHDK